MFGDEEEAEPKLSSFSSSEKRSIFIICGVLGLGWCCWSPGIEWAISILGHIRREYTVVPVEERRAEVHDYLELLATSVSIYCDETGRLPSAAGPLPAEPGIDHVVLVDFADDPTFRALGMTSDEVTASYELRPNDGGLAIIAHADPEETGSLSETRVQCSADCECAFP